MKTEREIYIEVDGGSASLLLTTLACVLLAAFLFGVIGYTQTHPTDPRLIGWDDWQLARARQAYLQELSVLQGHAGALAELLEAGADPVRGQLVCERVSRALSPEGLSALSPSRHALASAASAVSSWSRGAAARQEAVAALQQAIALLEEAQVQP